MECGLAASMTYGDGAGNNTKHHYSKKPIANNTKKCGKKGKRHKKGCKTV